MSLTSGQLTQAIGPNQIQSISNATAAAQLAGLVTPAAHASTHKSGGSDPIKLDELAAPTDVTTLNVSTTAHGLCPKAPNTTAQVLRGDGTFGVPLVFTGDSGSGGVIGAVPAPAAGDAAASKFLKADGTWAVTGTGTVTSVTGTAPIVSSGGTTPAISINAFTGDSGSGGAKGAVPAPASGDAAAAKYLFADGSWRTIVNADVSAFLAVAAAIGDTHYSDNGSRWQKLTGNTTTTPKYLRQVGNGSAVTSHAWAQPAASEVSGLATVATSGLATDLTGTLAVGHGGTGLAAGVSGGIPFYSSTSAMTSTGALTANGIVCGGGAGASPTVTAAMTDGQIVVGKTSNAPQIVTPTGDISFTNAGLVKANSVSGTDASGTNTAGTDVAHSGGKGTGNAEPGLTGIKYPLKGASGSTVQSLSSSLYPCSTTLLTGWGTTTTTSSVGGVVDGSIVPPNTKGTLVVEGGLLRVGRMIKVRMMGAVSSSGGANPTMTIYATLGGTTIATQVNALFTGLTASPWTMELFIACMAYASTGNTIETSGYWMLWNPAASTIIMPHFSNADYAIDVTANKTLDVRCTFTAVNGGTLFTEKMTVEYLN